jgi:hypothetical protein
MKSFEYVEWKSVESDLEGVKGEAVEVKLSGDLSLSYTRLDLASRGIVTTSETRYVEPNGNIFYFSS